MNKTQRIIAEKEAEEAKEYLLSVMPQCKYNVYTHVNYVSSSGMSRHISAYICPEAGEIVCINWYLAKLGFKWNKAHNALVVGGCGMDMCFHLVYSLGRILYPNGFIPKEHNHRYGRNRAAAEELDTDGGYALHYKYI